MAAINFPSTPVTNDTHTDGNGNVWVFDGTSWIIRSEVDDTPVNGATTVPISSNWAYDLLNSAQTINGAPWNFTGGTISVTGGAFSIYRVNDLADASLYISRDAGYQANVFYRTGDVNRWKIGTNSSAESGSDAGTNFQIARYNDAGTYQDDPITISRATGDVTIPNNLNLTGKDVVFTEKADHSSTPTAGEGYLWVKNDTPNALIYTDDAGTDFNLTESGATVTMSATAPVAPENGDLWWDTEDGLMSVWYEDGTSNQWVSTAANGSQFPLDSLSNVTITSPTTGALLSYNGTAWIDIDVDDIPVNGETTVPISSNWAYDHENDTTHPYTDTAKGWTKAQYFTATVLTDGATINWDASSNQVTQVTLGGNRTMAAPTNQAIGGIYQIAVLQDGTGSRTLTWNSVFKFAGGAAPTLTSSPGGIDVLTFRSNGTTMYEVGRSLNPS